MGIGPLATPRTLAHRARAHRKRQALDHALALGRDPSGSPELAARASELVHRDARRRLASSLMNLIDAAEEPASSWRAHGIDPPVRSEAVLEARGELTALADALKADRPPGVRGVALAARLVLDRRSPIYSSPATADVAGWARSALEAMRS